jgi:capsular exopolysaccharide synthesis family protein
MAAFESQEKTVLGTHTQVPQISRPGGPVLVRPAPGASASGITGKDLLRAIRRRMWVIIISVLTTTSLALVGSYLWEQYLPFYTADAYLTIIPPKSSPLIGSVEQTPREIMERMGNQLTRIVRDVDVMNEVLKSDDVQNTEWYKKYKIRGSAELLDRLSKEVGVSSVPTEGMIRISMTGTNPKEVALIVNAVADTAILKSRRNAQDRASDNVKNLSVELQSLTSERDKLAKQVAALRPADIPMFEKERSSLDLKLQQLTGQIVQLEGMQVQAKANLDQIKNTDMRNSAEVIMSVDQDGNLRSLNMLKGNLQTERDNAIRKYGPRHRIVQDLESRLRSVSQQIEQALEDVTNKSIEAVKSNRQAVWDSVTAQLLQLNEQLNITKAGMKGLEDTLQAVADVQRQMKDLEEQIKRIKDRLMEVNLQYPTENPLARGVVASQPLKPSWPLSMWIMGSLGGLLGVVIGFGLVFLLEFMDTSVKSSADITRRVDLPVLGMVPHGDDLEEDIADLRLAFASNPNSLVSEAFRQIRTCLQFSGPASQRRSLLVTSAQPEDGRTTVALNLAASVARSGRKVLVVDANFRQPAVHKLFPGSKDSGLSNVLVGQGNWRDLVFEVEPNLQVLSSGPLPPNPAELLGGEAMRQLIAELSSQYDQIIFDGAPALVVSDSVVLATLVDGVVLVVRAGANTHGIVVRTRELLHRVGAHMLGVALNGVRATAGGYLRKSYETFYDYHDQTALTRVPTPPRK